MKKLSAQAVAHERLAFRDEMPRQELELHLSRYVFAGAYAAGRSCLDVACGSGYGSHYLAQSRAAAVVGGDISVEALATAETTYHRPGLHFLRLDAHHLPFPEASFDLVVSFETVEHLPDPDAFVAGCRRVLREDGLLLCSTPNKATNSPYTRRPFNPFHLREFTLDELERLLHGHFPYVNLFGQNLIRRDLRWRVNILAAMVKPALLSLPRGRSLVDLLGRRLLGHRNGSLGDLEGDGWEAAYRKWPVVPLEERELHPVHFVAVASPRPLAEDSEG